MRGLIIIVSMCVLFASVSFGMTPEEMFLQGNDQFEARHFDSALQAYNQVLAQDMQSAPLYFNMGNACFRSGDLGHAILYYLKAQRLDPADTDILSNLDFARRFTSVQMEGVELNPVSSLFESIVEPYQLSTLAWISSAAFFLFLGFLIARFGFGYRKSIVRAGIYNSLFLLLVVVTLTMVKYDSDYLTQRAVVIAETAEVYTGPSDLSDKELDAAPGLIVEILSESGDFYNVLFENKRRGWIKKDLVAVV